MKYKSQKVAYWFFALSMLLLSLQLVYGFIMGFAHAGMDGLHDWIPFNTAKAVHTNLLVVWLLSGFMGAAYYIIPEESQIELVSVKLAYVQLITLALVGVAAIVGYHFNYWEGRKFLEIPRPLDYLVVVNVLLFMGLILATLYKGKRKTTTALVLAMGLLFAALLYLPGMLDFNSQVLDSFFRWWVVHLWVEGVWESGILGTGHHYYYIGVNKIWLIVGGIFSALEPLAFLAMTLFALNMYRKGEKKHPNKIALYWTLGSAIVAFIGAGLLGFAHTLPQTNLYTHGTIVTASHAHLSFWGAYAMIVFAIISYSLPNMTGRKYYDSARGRMAFWLANIGMLGMTVSFGVAGVAQVYMERIYKMDFMKVQMEIEVHFIVLIIMATLFATGITLYIIEFIKHGLPTDEALEIDNQ